MKTKDLIELIVAILIFVVAGYFIYTMLAPKQSSSSNSGPTIVQVTPINPTFDQTALQAIGDPTQTRDFYTPPDLSTGLGNVLPFGQ